MSEQIEYAGFEASEFAEPLCGGAWNGFGYFGGTLTRAHYRNALG